MLNRQEKEKIGKVLEQSKNVSGELQRIMTSLTEIRDEAQSAFERTGMANARIGLLEEELKSLITENKETAPGA